MELWKLEIDMDHLDGVRQYRAARKVNTRANAITAVIYATVFVCVTAACWLFWS